jgi:guanylate kinase
MTKGSILLLSGPSGSGKSSLLRELYKHIDNYYFSISTTTRPIRSGEIDKKDYYFISESEFLKDVEDGYFLEWAEVHGNFYGTSLKQIQEALNEDKLVIFDIDVQGFISINKKLSHLITSVFITTPSIKVLKQRLKSRATDSDAVIEKRLVNAIGEMEYIEQYDTILINDDFDKSAKELIAIAKYAQSKSHIDANEFKNKWKKR